MLYRWLLSFKSNSCCGNLYTHTLPLLGNYANCDSSEKLISVQKVNGQRYLYHLMSPIFSALDIGRTKKWFLSRSSSIVAQLVKIPDSCSGTHVSLCWNVRCLAALIFFNFYFYKMQGSFRGTARLVMFCAHFAFICELYDNPINRRKGY